MELNRNNDNLRDRLRLRFSDVLLLLIFCINFIPQLKEIVTSTVVLIAEIVWIIFIVLEEKRIKTWSIALLIWFVVCSLITLLMGNLMVFKVLVFEFFNLLFPFVAVQVVVERNYDDIDFYIKACIVLAVFSVGYTYFQTHAMSLASLYYRTSDSYTAAYVSVVLLLIFLYILFNSKSSKFVRILYIIVIGFLVFSIIFYSFFIGLIVFAISASLFIIFMKANSFSKKLLYSILLVLGVLILAFNLDSILQGLYNATENHYYKEKIFDIMLGLRGSSFGYTTSERMNVYSISLQTIKESPFIGCFWRLNDENIRSLISYHSSIFDMIAMYGVLFGIIPMYFLISPFKIIKKFSTSDHALVVSMMIAVILILLLDNMVSGIGIVAYFMTWCIIMKRHYDEELRKNYE
ncbi:MAG: hypothetical protein KA807_14030 [Prolixibacteraceae bacterium]|nr:hypothetical protein [Prolixibacteraceae bacterium]